MAVSLCFTSYSSAITSATVPRSTHHAGSGRPAFTHSSPHNLHRERPHVLRETFLCPLYGVGTAGHMTTSSRLPTSGIDPSETFRAVVLRTVIERPDSGKLPVAAR